jgi:hypothetical protein
MYEWILLAERRVVNLKVSGRDRMGEPAEGPLQTDPAEWGVSGPARREA